MKLILSAISAWHILITIVFLIVVSILYKLTKFGVLSYLSKRRFLRQGFPLVRYLGMNFSRDINRAVELHGDVMYPIKEAIKKYPDAKAFVVEMGPLAFLMLTDPEYIKDYSKHVIADYGRLQMKNYGDSLIKNGIVTLRGEEWKIHRDILSESLHDETFEKNIKNNYEATHRFFQSLTQEEMENFLPRIQIKRVLSATTGQTFFGENIDKRLIKGESALLYLMKILEDVTYTGKNMLMYLPLPELLKEILFPTYRRVHKGAKKIKALLKEIIQETRERLEAHPDQKEHNIIEGLIEGQKKYKNCTTLDDESIGSEFITLLLTGTDMTSVFLTITMYYLSRYPDLVAELTDEVHKVIPDGVITSVRQLNGLELMESTLKEVLRLHPPAGLVAKQAIRNTQVLDIKIRKGDCVGVGIQAIHMNPKYWENPEKFNPRRFMKGVMSPNMEPLAFIPFSTGARDCIGQKFAMIQAKLILSVFLNTFEFKLPPDYNFKLGYKMLYEPVEPVKFVLARKEQLSKQSQRMVY